MIYALDDSSAMLKAIERALRDLGEVSTSTLWSELGGKLVHASQRDVLVCDLHMAMMSGAEFCQIIRRYNSRVRIVFFTSKPEDAPQGLANAVVGKEPDGLPRLRTVVASLLDPGGVSPSEQALGRSVPA